MTSDLFATLTQKPESELLDLKREMPAFTQNKETDDAKLIKDIISFCNTIRTETAYIIYGIAEVNRSNTLVGIVNFPDDAILQQKVRSKVFPAVKFKSYTFRYDGLTFGIIEIPVHVYEEPVTAVVKLKGLEVGKVYLRRGSSNDEATGREVLAIAKWLETLQVERKSTELFQDQLASLAIALSDKKQPLSTSLSTCLGVAIRLQDRTFESFCYHELTGYKNNYESYGELAEHRVMNVVATPLTIQLNPYFSLKGDALLQNMLEKEHFSEERFFFDRSINELEGHIAWLTEKDDRALAKFEMSDKMMYPDSDRVNGKISIFMALSTFTTMYEKIRKTALKFLLDSRDQSFK